jgi:hypothetical protein
MIPTSIRRSFRVAALGCLLVAPRQADAARGKPLLTGQTTTYGAVGDTTAGIRRSYVDNGYGFVKDQRTGLYWEKKDDSGGIHDKDDTYTWSTPSSLVADGTAFSEFLAALNTVPCFAGFCDWRLPTKFELETIEDVGRIDPAVKHAFSFVCTAGCVSTFCSCTASNQYWTASTYFSKPSDAWYLSFYDGTTGFLNKSAAFRVRAVRGRIPEPTPIPTPTPAPTPTP